MKMRWPFVVGLLLCLQFVLDPMAFASPPDPSWLSGFWDDADFDDVILHLTGCCPALSSLQSDPNATAFAIFVGVVPDSHRRPSPDPASFSYDTRAPPKLFH